AREEYITRRRTPYGFVIEVRKSRKWGIWKPQETSPKGQSPPEQTDRKGQSGTERYPKKGTQIARRGQNKEDTAVLSNKETQQPLLVGNSPFWKEAGVRADRLPNPFAKLCEDLYVSKNGQTLGEFMGVCMDAWEAMGGKGHPPAFARAKAQIAAREREGESAE